MEDQKFKDLLRSLLQGPDVTWDAANLAMAMTQVNILSKLVELLDTMNSNLVTLYYLIDEELNPPHQKPGGEVGLSYPDTLAGTGTHEDSQSFEVIHCDGCGAIDEDETFWYNHHTGEWFCDTCRDLWEPGLHDELRLYGR